MANPLYLNANGSLDPSITDFFAAYSSADIASGSVTMTTSAMQVDTQSDAAADDLDTIVATNAEAGTALFVRSTSPDRVVTLKHLTGNIYSAGGDVILNDPQQLVMLVYSGTYWVVMNSGGAVSPITFTEASGEDRRCVIAERVKLYLRHIITSAAAARAGAVLSVHASLLETLRLVVPGVSASAVNGLAISLVAQYADEAAILLAFNDGFWDEARCSIYCGHPTNATLFTPAEAAAIRDLVEVGGTFPYTFLGALIGLIGANGLTQSVGLSGIDATAADCEGDCGCDDRWCYAYDFSASDGDWEPVDLGSGYAAPRTIGTYATGAWRDSAVSISGDPGLVTRGVYIAISPPATAIRRIVVRYDKTNGTYDGGANRRMSIQGYNSGTLVFDTGLMGTVSDGTDLVLNWTGDEVLDRIVIRDECRYSYSGSNGALAVKEVRIEGDSVNPFGTTNCGDVADDQLSLIPWTDGGAADTVIEYLGANRWRVTGHINGSTDRRFGFEDAFGRCINISTIHTQSDVSFRAFTNCAGTYSAGGGVLNTGNYRTGVWTNGIGGANPTAEFTATAS